MWRTSRRIRFIWPSWSRNGMFIIVSATAAAAVSIATLRFAISILVTIPICRRILPAPKKCNMHQSRDIHTDSQTAANSNLHVKLSPLIRLLPLRALVALIVVILFTAALADHLFPFAESSLLLGAPSDWVAFTTIARLLIESIVVLVVLFFRAGSVADLWLFAIIFVL